MFKSFVIALVLSCSLTMLAKENAACDPTAIKGCDVPAGTLLFGLNHGNGLPAEGFSPGATIGFVLMDNFMVAFDQSYFKGQRYPDAFNMEIEGTFTDLSFKYFFVFPSNFGHISAGVGTGYVHLDVTPESGKTVKKRYLEGFVEGGFEIYVTPNLSASMLMRQRLIGMIDMGSEILSNVGAKPKDFDPSTYTLSAILGINAKFNLF